MATIGVVVASGFEQAELTVLCRVLAAAGHTVRLISPKKHSVRAWDNTRWGGDLPVEVAAVEADLDGLAALAIPGGVISADTLRADTAVVRLVAAAAGAGRPVAALGHAPWVLVEAGLVAGRRVTSHPAIRSDLVHAGGSWRDEAAVVDPPLITGRHGHDADAFARAVAAALG